MCWCSRRKWFPRPRAGVSIWPTLCRVRERSSWRGTVQKDPRLVELVLRESQRVVRIRQGRADRRAPTGLRSWPTQASISRTSPIPASGEFALLLPEDPDASAARLRERLRTLTGCEPGVIINDSFGRPWRVGTVGVAIGVRGVGLRRSICAASRICSGARCASPWSVTPMRSLRPLRCSWVRRARLVPWFWCAVCRREHPPSPAGALRSSADAEDLFR